MPPWASASPDVFRLLIERAQTGILVLQDRQIIFANPQAAQLTDYSAEELTSSPMSLALIVAPEHLAMVKDELRQRMQGVPGRAHDLQCIRKGQPLRLEPGLTVVEWGPNGEVVMSLDDILEDPPKGHRSDP